MTATSAPDADADAGGSLARLRLRRTVAENVGVVVVVLLLVGGAGAWAGYTAHVDPGSRIEERTRTVSEWSRTATFEHGAEVTEPNPVYERGRRLADQGAYFPLVSPVLSGEYRAAYAASDGGRVDVEVGLRLIVRGRDDGTTVWRSSRGLAETEANGIAPGGGTAVAFRFDMNRTRVRLERVEETFGEVPGEPEVLVRAETRLTGEINGRTVDRTFVDDLRLVREGDAFGVRDPGEITNSTSRTTTVRVEREYSSLRRFGGPAAAVLGFGGAVGLAVARRRDRLALPAVARDRLERAEYDEWLSRGSIPDGIDPAGGDVVELAALVDLVDVAADTDGRVLYDPTRELYAVLAERYVYVCRPPLDGRDATEPPDGDEPADDAGPDEADDRTD